MWDHALASHLSLQVPDQGLEFSRKYHEEAFPELYASKHESSLARRLNNHREQVLLRRCLATAGGADSLVDVGCGPGRFWSTLAQDVQGELVAVDVSHAMLRYAQSRHAAIADRFELAVGSVTALPFVDQAFDTVVSLRLLHHFGETATRRLALAELARIARRHVIVSLWTDGNFKAWRRARLERRRHRAQSRDYHNRHVIPRDVLAEDLAWAGLVSVRHFDLLPGYSQWRYHVLTHA